MARKTSRSSDVAELANKAIAKRLRELVTDTTVLAKHLDCSIQAINQYKQGTSQPKIENIIKIAEFYNVSVDYLFGITETKNRDTTIQAVCEETGLSEKAVENVILVGKSQPHLIEAQNKLISNLEYKDFIIQFSVYLQQQKMYNAMIDYAQKNNISVISTPYFFPEDLLNDEEFTWGLEVSQKIEGMKRNQDFQMFILNEFFKDMVRKIADEDKGGLNNGDSD